MEEVTGISSVLDLNETVSKFLVSLSNTFPYPSVCASEPLMMHFFKLFICSISMNCTYDVVYICTYIPCVHETCFHLSKCLHSSIVLGFFTSFLRLLNLMRNRVSDSSYQILQKTNSNSSITQLLLHKASRNVLIVSFVWVTSNIVVVIISWHCNVLYGKRSPLLTFCYTFRQFSLPLILIATNFNLNDVFLWYAMSSIF